MKIPTNMSEAQVLASIEKIVSVLAHSFPFGYFDIDDIKQVARMKAIEGLEDYDETRPLENFLYAHIKNRLINFKRDNYERCDTPCRDCHTSINGQTQHPNGKYCEKYRMWAERNMRKKNVMSPLDITNISDEKEGAMRLNNDAENDVENKELIDIVDRALPIELRATYLQMRAGIKVSKIKKLEVEQAVLLILEGETDGE